jgi:hypothetical protein
MVVMGKGRGDTLPTPHPFYSRPSVLFEDTHSLIFFLRYILHDKNKREIVEEEKNYNDP